TPRSADSTLHARLLHLTPSFRRWSEAPAPETIRALPKQSCVVGPLGRDVMSMAYARATSPRRVHLGWPRSWQRRNSRLLTSSPASAASRRQHFRHRDSILADWPRTLWPDWSWVGILRRRPSTRTPSPNCWSRVGKLRRRPSVREPRSSQPAFMTHPLVAALSSDPR